ncbi:MAG: type III secretion T3S chaperone [Parachlamydiaceae bacterium]|nr:type III secretion T3S chaperone [Parachlamydiaceae bacterium]
MTPKLVYPLEQIIKVKQRRVEEQEKVVKQKEELLQKEKDKLVEREVARDQAKQHQLDKLIQLRHELDHETSSDKVTQMKNYLNVAKEKLAIEEKKVKDQKAQVEQAEKVLEAEKELLRQKRQEVDKLKNHKIDWTKEARKELDIIEGREQDELGSTSYLTHKRKNAKARS